MDLFNLIQFKPECGTAQPRLLSFFFKNEDILKYEDNIEFEYSLKFKDNLKYKLKYKNNLK